jgi:RNA polymerase sigma factor (sigma-70 family)
MTATFRDTRWTLVARSRGHSPHARAALSELCSAYYAPVVAFLKRDGRSEDAARDLAHDFFARLLQGGALDGADPERGRFRSYLLAAVKRFAAAQREAANTLKRGGAQPHLPLNTEGPNSQPALELTDTQTPTPDAAFDREWALTLLTRALKTLEQTFEAEGKTQHFTVLKPWLTTAAEDQPQSTAAAQLGLSEPAIKVAIHRLRQRFRDTLRTEIAQTLSSTAAIEEELEALHTALRRN